MSEASLPGNSYRLHPEVHDDLRGIVAYISQDSLAAAEQLIRAISATIESLVPPEVRHRGHRRHDLTSRPLLFILESVKLLRMRAKPRR